MSNQEDEIMKCKNEYEILEYLAKRKPSTNYTSDVSFNSQIVHSGLTYTSQYSCRYCSYKSNNMTLTVNHTRENH